VSCSQSNVGLIAAILAIGVIGQIVGVVWTAVDVYRTRRELTTKQIPQVSVRYRGMQAGMFGHGEDPTTRMIEQALNGAVEDVNRRLRELVTGTLKLRPWTVVLIACGMVFTLLGSLVWLWSPALCSS
jgi:hypothetical protein